MNDEPKRTAREVDAKGTRGGVAAPGAEWDYLLTKAKGVIADPWQGDAPRHENAVEEASVLRRQTVAQGGGVNNGRGSPRIDETRLNALTDAERAALVAETMPKTVADGRRLNDGIDALISERGQIHGDYTDHARITQRLKHIVMEELAARHERGQPELSDEARETLDMSCHKIGRIIAGKWDHPDHWMDLQGYARLVEERIDK